MRQLNTEIDWAIESDSPQARVETWRSESFEYRRITHRAAANNWVTLYAKALDENEQTFALGAFDTPEQADFFTALHRDNPLNIAALSCPLEWPVTADSSPIYEGVYRVGMKSYRVQPFSDSAWRVEYIEGYRVELLGETRSPIDACLLVYNHFDGRLRGCKLC